MSEKHHEGHLRREIGAAGTAFMVLNGLIGASIFALPATLMADLGLFSPWMFPVVGLLFIAIVLTFGELAAYFSATGGPVLYTYTAFGPLVGFQTGWLLYLGRLTAMAANTNVLIAYAGFLIPGISDGPGHTVAVVAVIGGLGVANWYGVKGAIRILGILSTLKVLPVLLLIGFGLPHVDMAALIPDGLPNLEGKGASILLLMYALVGFEGALVAAGETKNPRRTIPRVLVSTVLAITVFYSLIQLTYVAVNPPLAEGSRPLVEMARLLAGSIGAVGITLAAAFSIGGNLMANMVAVPRMTFAMAEEKTLPKWFGHLHEKYNTPTNSILFYVVVTLVLTLTGSFVWLAIVSTLARLVAYALCIVALPIIRRNADAKTKSDVKRLPGGYAIPLVGLALCIWAMSYSALESWVMLGAMMALGTVLSYLGRGGHRDASND